MKKFYYKALDAQGQESKGTVESADSNEALRRLKEMGLFPTKLTPTVEASAEDRPAPAAVRPKFALARRSLNRRLSLPWRSDRVKPRALEVFTRQLATLLEAGMPLLRGLRILADQERHPVLREVIARLVGAVEGGGTFTEGLALCPKVFSPLYLGMTKAGEQSGALDVVLARLAVFMEKAARIKGKVVAAMFYPAAVLTVAAGIMAVLMTFVVPRFRAVFSELMEGQPLPLFTQAVLAASQVVRDHGLVVLLLVVAGAVLGRVWTATPFGRRALDLFKLRMPLLGPLFCKTAMARFSRTLGTLLGSGVPILQALTLVRETTGNCIVGDAVDSVNRSVKEGETITLPLRASGVFPAMVVGMVDIGEQTGALPDMLMKIADHCEDDVDHAVSAMTSLLEPIMIVILALLVGSIVIALFLPLITVMDHIGGGDAKAGE